MTTIFKIHFFFSYVLLDNVQQTIKTTIPHQIFALQYKIVYSSLCLMCLHAEGYNAFLYRLPYRPRHSIFHGNVGQLEEYVSYWDHIENLHNNSMLFYNFKYKPTESTVS